MLSAITYAREHDLAYLGTCGGFQYALIEFTRNVLGVADADSAEHNPTGKNIVIMLAYCATPGALLGAPRLAGPGVARPLPDTLLATLCGSAELAEQYFCSFETNFQRVGMFTISCGARDLRSAGDFSTAGPPASGSVGCTFPMARA
jgi:CTP synthase (UTP-ammonia lyase)